MSLLLKYTFGAVRPPKHNTLVLVSFTIIWLLEQNFSRPFRRFGVPLWYRKIELYHLPTVSEREFHLRWQCHAGCLSSLPSRPCIYGTSSHWRYLPDLPQPGFEWLGSIYHDPKMAFIIQASQCVNNTTFPPTIHQFIKYYITINHIKSLGEIYKAYEEWFSE